MLQHRLPYPTSGEHFVQILPATSGTAVPGALLCTEDGNVSVWPDLADASAPPLQARVAGTVCAVAAAPSPDDGGFVAAFATTDGALHLLQVIARSAPGVHERRCCTASSSLQCHCAHMHKVSAISTYNGVCDCFPTVVLPANLPDKASSPYVRVFRLTARRTKRRSSWAPCGSWTRRLPQPHPRHSQRRACGACWDPWSASAVPSRTQRPRGVPRRAVCGSRPPETGARCACTCSLRPRWTAGRCVLSRLGKYLCIPGVPFKVWNACEHASHLLSHKGAHSQRSNATKCQPDLSKFCFADGALWPHGLGGTADSISAAQLAGAGGHDSAELIWSAELSPMLQPGLRAAAVAALDMAIIGAGNVRRL